MRLRLASLILCLAVGFGAVFTAPAPVPAQEVQAASVSVLDRATIWIYQKQRQFHRELTGSFLDLRREGSWAAAWTLIAASFLYGVFHAAGPGHGKAVMSGYLLTHRETLRRGVMLASAGAFMQGLTAVFIVYGLIAVAGWLPRETQTAVVWSERASFALVAAIGLFLLYRALKSLRRRLVAGHHALAHDNDHDHGSCGHAHAPTPEQVEAAINWRTAFGIVMSIGARPCTGAVIVLVFAKVANMPWPGIFAVMAMSLGTAITTSSLATAAVGARGLAERLSPLQGRTAGYAVDAVSAAGGVLILLLGISLLSAAFGPQHPLGVG